MKAARLGMLLAIAATESTAALVALPPPPRRGRTELRVPAVVAGATRKGPPPIPSRHFTPLSSPSNFTTLLEGARDDQVTVVKFQAPWCRTCRAMAPKLDKIARAYPTAAYYSIESVRNGKAAGERMHKFFLSRNAVRVRRPRSHAGVPSPPRRSRRASARARPSKTRAQTALPYLEVYCGDRLVEASAVPPSNLEPFSIALGQALLAVEREVSARWRRERRKLRALLQPPPRDEDGAAGGGAAGARGAAAAARRPGSGRSRFGDGDFGAAARTLANRRSQQPRPPPRRAAPLRGATGPRGKRGYS